MGIDIEKISVITIGNKIDSERKKHKYIVWIRISILQKLGKMLMKQLNIWLRQVLKKNNIFRSKIYNNDNSNNNNIMISKNKGEANCHCWKKFWN